MGNVCVCVCGVFYFGMYEHNFSSFFLVFPPLSNTHYTECTVQRHLFSTVRTVRVYVSVLKIEHSPKSKAFWFNWLLLYCMCLYSYEKVVPGSIFVKLFDQKVSG